MSSSTQAAHTPFGIWAKEKLLKNRKNEKIPEEYKFDLVRVPSRLKSTFGYSKTFGSDESMKEFLKKGKRYENFTSEGFGVPVMTRRSKPYNIKKSDKTRYLYRYEIYKIGDCPHGDFELKGVCDGFLLYKVLFGTLKSGEKSTPFRVELETTIEFLSEPKRPKYFLFRLYNRSWYVVADNNALLKWEFRATGEMDGANSIFTIRAWVNRPIISLDDPNFLASILEQDWNEFPIIGFYDRCLDDLYPSELRRRRGEYLFLGEKSSHKSPPISLPWMTQLNMCVWDVVRDAENEVLIEQRD